MEPKAEPQSQKKRPIALDWTSLLTDDDHEPPPQLVVKSMAADHSSADDDLASMTEHELLESIRRKKNWFESTGRRVLKDGGAKMLNTIKRQEDELARRKRNPPRQAVEEEDRPRHAATASGDVGVSSDLRRGNISSQAPLQSSFASCFVKKMEDDTNHTPVDAYRKEMNHFKKFNNQTRDNGGPKEGKRLRSSARKFPFECPSNLSKCDAFNNDRSGRATSTILPQKLSRKEAVQAVQLDGLRSRKGQPILIDDDDDEPCVLEKTEQCVMEKTEQEKKLAEYLKDAKIYYPSSDDPECVEVSCSDIDCLAPESYLTSTIMNFYIRYLKQQASLEGRSLSDYHFFNTYFYKKLKEYFSYKGNDRESFFVKFRRWWKGVNIFKKAYIFIPIHEDLHWSLIIIYIPDKEDDSGPIILHLDSLSLHSSISLFDNIKSYLIEERNYLDKEGMSSDVSVADRVWRRLPRRIDTKVIMVPQQRNEYDCGLFVLYFIQRFIEQAPEKLERKNLAMIGRWFRPEEASSLRLRIRNLLVAELQNSINPTISQSSPSLSAGTASECIETADNSLI